MIRIIDVKDAAPEEIFYRGEDSVTEEIDKAVRAILDDVKANGDEAVLKYTEKFDGVKLDALCVTEEEIEQAYSEADKFFIESLEKAAANIAAFHEKQKRAGFEFSGGDGIVLGQRVLPLAVVGIYVPGGTASYPSTVLMNAIP